MDLPQEGARINLSGHFGTVRFIGEVDNTTGIWLGIEWDDPQRGKHDGIKDGKRYFTCRSRNSGSFIRPSAHISYGRSFVEALTAKYIETFHGSESQETIVLGSSHGAIMVEAVRLDKIRGKLSNLATLREVSLDNENVARSDPPGIIRATCPEIRGLDLSMSLLPSWDVVALITMELPVLQRLALNRNRLQPPKDHNTMRAAFLHLAEVRLNGTTMTWAEMKALIAFMPTLQLVEMGYNGLTQLESQDDEPLKNDTIQVINLDSNMCYDWVHVVESLLHFTSLQRLILTSNYIGTIPFPENLQKGLLALKHISLSHNKINAWSDIDALSSWCPGLETLTLSGNPLTDREKAGHSRPFTISKIPSLLTLDGAAISLKERADSEIFYQSYIIQHGPASEDERVQAHPQWLNLCAKHERPSDIAKKQASQDKLSQHLIGLNLHQTFNPVPAESKIEQASEPLVLRVLPTMTLKALRLKACKALKRFKATITLWLQRADGTLIELNTDCDQQSLDRLGLEDGSNLVFRVTM